MRLLVESLAVARLTRLVTEDEITRPVRERVERWADGKPEGSVAERASFGITCAACSSVWAAAAVLAARGHPVGRSAVAVLALSQAGILVLAVNDRLDR